MSVDQDHLDKWRTEVRAWLSSVAKPRSEDVRVWGQGDPDLQIFRVMSEEDERAYLDRVRDYRRKRYDAGYGAITLGTEYGGAGMPSVYGVAFAEEERAFENQAFPDHWNAAHAPSEWSAAGDALDRDEFWRVFHHCSGKLPDRIARVFLLREVDGIPSDEICTTLNISPNNLWVMLHRARMALRRCLEVNWFHVNPGEAE